MNAIVVAVLDRPEAAAALLSAAARLCDLLAADHVSALVVRVPPLATIMPTEEVLTVEREAEIRAQQAKWGGQMKAAFDTWCGGAQRRGAEVAWVDVESDLEAALAEHAAPAAALVVAQPAPESGAHARHVLHAALFATGRPVLIVPAGGAADFGDEVAIAWKDDGHAAKAALSGMPILRRARRVHVLRAGEASAELPAILRDHSVAAKLHIAPAGDGSTGEKLLALAHALGADMLVMGAYGHGEWREALFGGVTRHVQTHADLPVFMQH